MKFAEKIKNLRQSAGLTQQELAKHLGITASAIGFLENEKREPTGSTLVAYAKHFDIPIDELVGLSPDLEDHFSTPIENYSSPVKMRLQALREERNLTQNEVATAISTNQRNIGRWEKGENEPSASFVVSLADFFEVSTDYLLGREDDFGNVIVAGNSPRDELTADERTLLADFRTLPDGERAQALAYVEYLAEKRGAKTKKA